MDCYVYALIDPRTSQPFYVGKGKGQRAFQHLYPKAGASSGNRFRLRIIAKIRAVGLEPTVTFLHVNLSEEEASQREIETIAAYGRRRFDPGGILANLTLGGEGTSGFQHYGETKVKIKQRVTLAWVERKNSTAWKNRQLGTRILTPAQVDVVKRAGAASGAKSRGKPRSEEVKRKIRETKARNRARLHATN